MHSYKYKCYILFFYDNDLKPVVFLFFPQANQEPQVTYADLASFNNNHDIVVHMPAPYQPVEYAEIIGKKTSKEK